jgi:hypothetical protein
MANNSNSITVRHIDKDHILIQPAKGYSIVLFKLANGNIEALAASDDGEETIRLLVLGPEPDQTMSILNCEDGSVEITYEDKPSGR